jgi:protein-L-isoaspartate(D-aspartate) O-methyltransferase
MDFSAARQVMVDSQVRTSDVTNRKLQSALLKVARETLLPEERRFEAYADVSPTFAPGRQLMLPRDVGKLLQALEPVPGERALAIGAPYAALVMAQMGLEVVAQEADEAAAALIGPALAEAGVRLEVAPFDAPTGGPYDLVVSEGAVSARPDAWLDALQPGGRLGVVERTGPIGKAVLYQKQNVGLSRRALFESAAQVLAGMEAKPTFAF